MKAGRAIPFVLLVAVAMAAEPVLPPWDAATRAGEEETEPPIVLLVPENETEEATETPDPIPEPDASMVGETVGDEPAFEPLPEEFWSAYFAERPEAFLIDPQQLLAPAEFRARLDFLNYHAGDSRIDLFIYLFAADQDIPAEVRDEELIERFFSQERPAAVVYYFLGAPQRAVVKFSPQLIEEISGIERQRVLESPVIQASREVEPTRQLEAFLAQMSIRLYWLETLLHDVGKSGPVAALPSKPVRTPAPAKRGLAEWIAPYLAQAKQFFMPVSAATGGLLAMWLAAWWLKRRARYRFPDFEVEPRLGGAHAAGVGAVISFASASVPPASQRDQIPDYLRRAR